MRIGAQAFRRTAPDPLKGRTDVVHLAHVRRTDPEGIGDVVRQQVEFLVALAQRVLRPLALGDDARGRDEEDDLAGFVPQRLQGEVDVDEMVFRHAHLHVVAGGLPARGPRDGLTQLLLDVRGIGPPVGFLEGLAEDVFRLQTSRRQCRAVGLDQDSLGRHQSHEDGRAKSVDEIAQALLTLLRRLLADAQFLPGLAQFQLRREQVADHLGERSPGVRRQFAGVVRHSV